MKLCEATLLTSAGKKKKEKDAEWGKRWKDKAALKSSRASAGAAAGVPAQRCNKEEGGCMTEAERGGAGGLLVKSPLWCVFVLRATQLLSSTNESVRTYGKVEEDDKEIKWKTITERHQSRTQTWEISHYTINFWWPTKVVFTLGSPFPTRESIWHVQRKVKSANTWNLQIENFVDVCWFVQNERSLKGALWGPIYLN